MSALELKPQDPIQIALAQLSVDAGALYAPQILESIRAIRRDDPASFARLRQQAKSSKALSMTDFDRLTASTEDKASANDSIFVEVEPWHDQVDGAQLLNDVTDILHRHVIADRQTLQAAALWCVFTWALEVVQVAPIANITAPEKRCGKTILLTAIGKLAYRPLQASDIATAALFRSIELWSPTLLIDEVDAFLRDNEEARGILNAGFTRDSAFVIRCVGDDHMPTKFNVWGAKALCGIGKIADTLSDRSVPLRMRRKKPGETAAHLRHSEPKQWDRLRSQIARFIDDNAMRIAVSRPKQIDGLNDRANDCWEPLLQVAEVAGGHWPQIARHAALFLHGVQEASPSIGVELLADIKSAFDDKHVSKFFSAQLLETLVQDEEAPWATWNRGKAMTPRQLSAKLADFGVKPGSIRIGTALKKGYSREQFADAFDRYLSSEPPVLSGTPAQPSNYAGCNDFSSGTLGMLVPDEKIPKASNHAVCAGVPDETPCSWGVEV